jgi:hypothetical protein
MRQSFCLALLASFAVPGLGIAADAPRPQKLGEYASWIAATYTEGGQKICYAFTRPTRSEPGGRQGVLLTVTHRSGARDTVTIASGYSYPRYAEATVTVGATVLPFYTAGSTAAARDGTAAVRVFRNGREAVLKGPGVNGRGTVVDSFPLAGFGNAHDAIDAACPTAAPTPKAPPAPARRR